MDVRRKLNEAEVLHQVLHWARPRRVFQSRVRILNCIRDLCLSVSSVLGHKFLHSAAQAHCLE